MRNFELLLCILTFITLICALLKRVNQKVYYSLIALLPLMAAHYFLEGIRWQMVGVYVSLVVLIVISALSLIKNKKFSKISKILVIFSLILVVISSILISFFGAHTLPEPNGEYKVGTMSYDLTDVNRKELYNGLSDESRKFRIQIWYPADDITGGKMNKWLEDVSIPRSMVNTWIGKFSFALDYAALINTNSYSNVELSDAFDKYPVVIISHGWISTRAMHTNFAEALASNGYIGECRNKRLKKIQY